MTTNKPTAQTMLSGVQQLLKAPKNQFNSFGKYNYRNCEDILEALKEVMPDGAIVILSDRLEMVGDRIYIEATAKFCFNGETIEAKAYAREPADKKGMDASQITGTASSYARKYALNGLFCIDDSKDTDTDESQIESTKRASKIAQIEQRKANKIATISKEQAMELLGLLKEANIANERIFKHYNITDILQLSIGDFSAATDMIKKKMAKKAEQKANERSE